MATEKHKQLADIIKLCHDKLRQQTRQHGPENAWRKHLDNEDALKEYAQAMQQLASIWEDNASKMNAMAQSRIQWTINYCMRYFKQTVEPLYLTKRLRELSQLSYWKLETEESIRQAKIKPQFMEQIPEQLRLLDVGSCFNPFRDAPHFQVTAIDLCPAHEGVYRGDFLQIPLGDVPELVLSGTDVEQLPRLYYDCVVFSLLLEYIPTSAQRLECCRKAYELLRYEGILVIITPDSQHVGKNAALMKNWRYTLALLGFSRICFEKLPHITCLVFRKACDAEVPRRWAEQHCEAYMSMSIEIPQDHKEKEDVVDLRT